MPGEWTRWSAGSASGRCSYAIRAGSAITGWGWKLVGRRSNRDGIGAWIKIRTAAGEQWNHVTTSVGYASSSDVRVHFGLGAAEKVTVEVHWPAGGVQQLGEIAGDRYVTVKEE